MTQKRFSGLDELMIVNPGFPSMEKDSGFSQIYLGKDGTIYHVEGLHNETSPNKLAEFYLGDDGTLYQLESSGPSNTPYFGESRFTQNLYGQCFLGEDGTIYQVVAP